MTALKATDDFVLVATNGAASVVLYDPDRIPGWSVTVKNDVTQLGTTTITTDDGDIDGSPSVALTGANKWIRFTAWGGRWLIVSSSELGYVPSTRTLQGTAPITIAGDNAAHDLSANRTIAISDATTGAVGAVKLAQDLGGTGALPTVVALTGTTAVVAVHATELLWDSSGPGIKAGGLTSKSLELAVHTSNAYISLYDYGVGKDIGAFTWNAGSPLFQFGPDGVTCQILANNTGQILNLIGKVTLGVYSDIIKFGATNTTQRGQWTSAGLEIDEGLNVGNNGTGGVAGNYNVVLNASGDAIATNATSGFVYVPTCAGPPTGTPSPGAGAGAVPFVFDTTGNKLWYYVGGGTPWICVALDATGGGGGGGDILTGTNLTDAAQNLQVSGGNRYVSPVGVRSNARAKRLLVSGAATDEIITVEDRDGTGNDMTIVDDASSTLLHTFDGTNAWKAVFQFNGANWVRLSHWKMPP